MLDANCQGETPVPRELAEEMLGDSGFLGGFLEMMETKYGGRKVGWSQQMHHSKDKDFQGLL